MLDHTEGLPYDFVRLDELMEAAGIDVLLATSKHNVQYLLGGYRFIFFSAMDAIGHSRYLPVVAYIRGAPDRTAYVGNRMEGMEHANHPFWTPHFHPVAWGTTDAMTQAIRHLKDHGPASPRIGVEPGFLPMDAAQALTAAFANAPLTDATDLMERLRAVKTPAELALLKEASQRITDSMQATIAAARTGSTKHEIIDRLRREETGRGLQFEYCLLTLGASHNRAASNQAWAEGEVLSIDSGGNLKGYIGDICRMGVLGEPDSELTDLLAEIETVQQAAFAKVRAGAQGSEVITAGQAELARQPNRDCTDFFAHGMGVITHEAPFLMTNHPVTYEGVDADRPLQAGMVLSVETTMQHPSRGFVKLEDTLAVTETGYELYGSEGRGWNRGGTA
ncbi:M24 family metallopeptidase [Chachezhania antarctica]|uniref:M24 family metallopeptidase n=1 Tax=Chachezhania antarctica TaxID=2340860 RepID=UPI000EAE5412|nr:Xaa-Pro peptidase family protein [Chachezhania antarctica]|tara:strand:- start:4330 stop:5505 length:1176 start_codon:yes stop_codon:yes gene_type:complete